MNLCFSNHRGLPETTSALGKSPGLYPSSFNKHLFTGEYLLPAMHNSPVGRSEWHHQAMEERQGKEVGPNQGASVGHRDLLPSIVGSCAPVGVQHQL